MKKLMILACMLAGMSQAASVLWNSGTLYTPNGNGTFSATMAPNAAAYTATAYFFSDAGGTIAVSGLSGNIDNAVSAVSVLNGTASASPIFAASTVYYTKIVILDSTGNWQQTSTLASFTVPGTGNSSLNYLTGGGFDVVSNKLPGQWTAVPEPASMALFGIGAAVMGLRRRFKKAA